MSTSRSVRWGRKKRYAIASVVAVIGISISAYYAMEDAPYKNFKTWNFDSYKDNVIPEGFPYFQTDVKNDSWIVKSDPSAPSSPNVFAKLKNNDTSDYHIQVMPDGVDSVNYEASVQIKISSAEKSQAAGLVFRFVDSKQYFVLAADAVSKTFSLCRGEPGELLCLVDKQANVTADQWHTITADVSAQGVGGYFDGNELIKRYDQHYQHGQIGLWTKNDTISYFDNLEMKY